MIRKRSYNRGLILDRSFRSYALNTALRLFVKPQFKSETKPPAEMRDFMKQYIEGRAKFPAGTRHWEDKLGGVNAHWFRAGKGESRGVLLYWHGGAFVVRTPKAHGAFVSELAQRTGMLAVMPEYRLAPEEPFPAAVEDVMACYRELLVAGLCARGYCGGRRFCWWQPDHGAAAAGFKGRPSHAGSSDLIVTGDGSERPIALAQYKYIL